MIEFRPTFSLSDIAFCIVDRTEYAATDFIKEIVKNQADYTLSNIVGKGHRVYQGFNENSLLHHAISNGHHHAVVLTTGTEFINGSDFFDEVKKLARTDVALAGHILDRKDAYYELHHQCYFINLEIYKNQGMPKIGDQELGAKHTQEEPKRSEENFHDDYTPLWISSGDEYKDYNHKCHGWNILSVYLDADLKIEVFNEKIKNSKKHIYPEYVNDFNKNVSWLYYRQNYCANNFVHTDNTEVDYALPNTDILQLVTPASGIQLQNLIQHDKKVKVVFYDYNKAALEYWQKHAPKADNVEYKFVYADFLGEEVDVAELIDPALADNTLVNLSNIFCYEGTCTFANLNYRIYKENQLISNIKRHAPESYIRTVMRANLGFEIKSCIDFQIFKAKDMPLIDVEKLHRPTWHMNRDL